MEQHVPTAAFLTECCTRPLLDVRSPGEFAQGHIPGAHNLPLFSDDERAEVGTLYKQKGKEHALLRGLEIVGPKMAEFIRQGQRFAPDRKVAVHCWRGGQRSQSMAWLFRQAGFDVVTLDGGYKQYRRFVLDSFSTINLPLQVIGGKTGSGKTKILHSLLDLGEQIIDLEAIAHHKGSSFGSIGEQPQPTVEQFENDLLAAIRQLDNTRRIWIENESRSIGRVYLPDGLWQQMKYAPLYNVDVPLESRIQNLVNDYVGISALELEMAFRRIEKKLGGQYLKAALEALAAGDYATAARIALQYYDKTYRYGLETNPSPAIQLLNFTHGEPDVIAKACINAADAAGNSVGKPLPLDIGT